jgi:hypothetical protein
VRVVWCVLIAWWMWSLRVRLLPPLMFGSIWRFRAFPLLGSFPGLPGRSPPSTPFPLPNLAEREGRKASISRDLLGGTVAAR